MEPSEPVIGPDKVKVKTVVRPEWFCWRDDYAEPAGSTFDRLGGRDMETIEAAPWRTWTLIGNRNAVVAGRRRGVKFCGCSCSVLRREKGGSVLR